jgi:DNA-binding SARP family transcriptional activator
MAQNSTMVNASQFFDGDWTIERPVRLLLCGRAMLSVGSEQIELPNKLTMLLTLLAFSPATDRSKVAAWIYPAADVSSARRNLRQLLHHHRKLLTHLVTLDGTLLSLLPTVELDVIRPHANVAANTEGALDTTLVPLLDNRQFDGHPHFQTWLDGQRALQMHLQLDRMANAASRHENQGELTQALGLARRIRDADPTSEHAHCRVMRLHYLRGDRAAALASFERCERFLKDELGVRPSAETLALLDTIEAARQTEPAPLDMAALPVSLHRPPVTVGREQVLKTLFDSWARGEAFWLVGDAGMGKSRLLDELAQQRAHTLVVRARHGDARHPYATLARLLSQLPNRTVLTDLHQRVLKRLTSSDPVSDGSRLTGEGIFSAAVAALHAAQVHPVVDDLHLADPASLELLSRLASHAPLQHLHWGFATRPCGDPTQQTLYQRLVDRACLRQVPLEPLQLHQIHTLLTTLQLRNAPLERLSLALQSKGGGNPLFTLALLKDWHVGGQHADLDRMLVPQSVQQLVGQQFEACSTKAMALARLAALAASDFSVELAEAVLGESALSLADAWRELETRQLMRANLFAHDLLQETAARSVPQSIATHIHARIAAHLSQRGGHPANIAAHWESAHQPLQALPFLVQAAHQAIATGRSQEAGQFYEMAGDILHHQGDSDGAFEHYFDACEMYVDASAVAPFERVARRAMPLAQSPRQRVRAALMEAFGSYMRGDMRRGGQQFTALLDQAIAVGEKRCEAECRFEIARVMINQGTLREALQMAAAAGNLFRELGLRSREHIARGQVELLVLRAGLAPTAAAHAGQVANARRNQVLAGLERRTRAIGDWVTPARIAANAGDFEVALALIDEVAQDLATQPLVPSLLYPHTAAALETLIDLGRLDLAAEMLRRHDLRQDVDRGDWWHAVAVERVALYQALGRSDLADRARADLQRVELFGYYVQKRLSLLRTQVTGAYDPCEEHMGLRVRCALQLLSGGDAQFAVLALEALQAEVASVNFGAWLPSLQILLAMRLSQLGKHHSALQWAELAEPALQTKTLASTRASAFAWLHQVRCAVGDVDGATRAARCARDWILHQASHHTPEVFRESFLQRQPLNHRLLSLTPSPLPMLR